MAPAKGDLTASMAILGLLIQQPDTPSHVRGRLARDFPHGRWSPSIAYNDMRDLARQDLIRRIRMGEKRSEDVFEATPEGRAALKEWLRDASRAPPAVRDAMLLWLEHSDESEKPEILEVIRELEKIARAEFEAAQTRLNTERMLGNLGPPDGSDWHGRMRNALLTELVLMSGQQCMRLVRLRQKVLNKGRELHAEAAEDGDG
jgi:DNA-binding PadR family transcriptional regulator